MAIERVESRKTFDLAQKLYLWPRDDFDKTQQRENHRKQNCIDSADRDHSERSKHGEDGFGRINSIE